MREYLLNNGVGIPVLGFGTWKAQDGEEAYQTTLAASRQAIGILIRLSIRTKRVSDGQSRTAEFRGRSSSSRLSFGMTTILMRRLKRPLRPQWAVGTDYWTPLPHLLAGSQAPEGKRCLERAQCRSLASYGRSL